VRKYILTLRNKGGGEHKGNIMNTFFAAEVGEIQDLPSAMNTNSNTVVRSIYIAINYCLY